MTLRILPRDIDRAPAPEVRADSVWALYTTKRYSASLHMPMPYPRQGLTQAQRHPPNQEDPVIAAVVAGRAMSCVLGNISYLDTLDKVGVRICRLRL